MKISQVMLAGGLGGAERLFVDFCIALAEAGDEIQAICRKDSAAAGMLQHHKDIKLATVSVWGNWDLLAKIKIASLLKNHGSQVVQAHLARGALLAAMVF